MTGSDRGRVPFALVGVLLLVSSATIAATSGPNAPAGEPAVGTAMERATAESQTAIRDGVRAASRDAARSPVLERANTSTGRVLNESDPFVDSLRIRIYLAVRQRLADVDRYREGVRVQASLPPVSSASDLREAKRRVRVRRADENGTAVTVTISNVTVSATRGDRTVTEREMSPNVTVATPVLALHDRVEAYERQLDAGVDEPGLDQRLTAQLYGVAWARGYGQYAGAPIENVVSNRHVAIATNAGVLDVQRATIGHSDSAGRRTLTRATAKAGAMELIEATGAGTPPGSNPFASPTRQSPDGVAGLEPPDGPRPNDTRVVGVNRTADAALLDLVENETLEETIETVYTADARLVSNVEHVDGGPPGVPAAPSGDWSLVDEERTVHETVTSGDRDPPGTPPGWHRFASYQRTVSIERIRVREWRRGNETRQTSARDTETVRVGVAVVGRHATSDRVPANGIDSVHERGRGPFDGPNLAGIRNQTIQRLVDQRGGPDVLVARAATGSLDTRPVQIEGETPGNVSEWAYRDLMELRERVREVQVSVQRGRVGTFEANPPGMLANRLRDRRGELVGVPDTYDSTAAKARHATRSTYLERVLARLEDRSERRAERGDRFGDVLSEEDAGSLDDVRRDVRAIGGRTPERGATVTGVGGPVSVRVDSAPSYLTMGEVSSDRVPAVNDTAHPLVARNVNLFTVPYGDAADAVVDGGTGGSSGEVRLRTAARTLRAANDTLTYRPDSDVRDRRDALQTEVRFANQFVSTRLRQTLSNQDIGKSTADREAIVAAGLARWTTTAARGIALSNGSASERVAAVTARRANLSAPAHDRLRLRLAARNREALSESLARPSVGQVDASREATRDVATNLTRRLATNATANLYGKATNETLDQMPSGLPLAPVPGHWYATTNVWHVTVRGEYARFGVRADRGRPTDPGGEVTYTRDGREIRLDVDADGHGERLGRSSRVDFDVSTTVVVVVPPGKTGVGDRGGDADERSDGWPHPGPE